MTIEETEIVDFINLEEDGRIALFISDHLNWRHPTHFELLQDKVNLYLSYIDDGQMFEDYPEHIDTKKVICLACKYEPDARSLEVLHEFEDAVAEFGVGFEWRTYD